MLRIQSKDRNYCQGKEYRTNDAWNQLRYIPGLRLTIKEHAGLRVDKAQQPGSRAPIRLAMSRRWFLNFLHGNSNRYFQGRFLSSR